MPTLRNEQGKDLMEYLNVQARGRPIVCSGDFNAEPIEPVYQTLTSCPHLRYVHNIFVYISTICLLLATQRRARKFKKVQAKNS